MENKLLALLDEAETVAISGHVRPDGDCVGACMALYHYVKDNYCETEVSVFLEPIAESYKVIDGTEKSFHTAVRIKSLTFLLRLTAEIKSVLVLFQNTLTLL